MFATEAPINELPDHRRPIGPHMELPEELGQ